MGKRTSGTDWTGPKPDGPAIGSVESVGSDDIGLVIPLLLAINPLDVDVHVDVVVALPFPVAEEPLPFPTWIWNMSHES